MANGSYSTNFPSITDADPDSGSSNSDSEDLVSTYSDYKEEEEDETDHMILFGEFLWALQDRIKAARHVQLDSHPSESKDEHNAYWRSFFMQVRQDAAAGVLHRFTTTTSQALGKNAPENEPLYQQGACLEPPANKLGIVFAKRDEAGPSGCPCMLAHQGEADYYIRATDASPGAVIAQPESSAQAASRQGVTFDMLIKGISDSLYGNEDGIEAEYAVRQQDLPVIHDINCMLGLEGLIRNKIYVFVDDVATGAESIDAGYRGE